MRIDHQHRPTPAATSADQASRVKLSTTGDAAPASRPADGDGARVSHVRVNVSSKARELAASAGSVEDSAKVSRLKDAISNGTFKVDAQKVAAKIAEDGG
jgi:negative regulator of flagellin synthesis FlgM